MTLKENKMICKKCGLSVHPEVVKPPKEKTHTEYLHDDLDTAWCRIDGKAHNLHFVEAINKEEVIRKEGAEKLNPQ